MMRLIYDGILSPDEASSCESASKDYRFAVEFSRLPESQNLDDVLKQRTWQHTGDSGCGDYTYERRGVLYRFVHKDFLGARDTSGKFIGGGFIFVKDKEDHAAIVASFGELIASEKPFKTELEFCA